MCLTTSLPAPPLVSPFAMGCSCLGPILNIKSPVQNGNVFSCRNLTTFSPQMAISSQNTSLESATLLSRRGTKRLSCEELEAFACARYSSSILATRLRKAVLKRTKVSEQGDGIATSRRVCAIFIIYIHDSWLKMFADWSRFLLT